MTEQAKNIKFKCTQIFGFGDLPKIFKPIREIEVSEQGIIFNSRSSSQSVSWEEVQKVWIDSVEKFLKYERYQRKILYIKTDSSIYKFLISDRLDYAGLQEAGGLIEEIKKHKEVKNLSPKKMLLLPWWSYVIGLVILYVLKRSGTRGTMFWIIIILFFLVFLTQGFIYRRKK